MLPFNFESVKNSNDAIQSHSRSSMASFLAGGTTLVDLMKLHVETPEVVVDISSLPLKQITDTGSSVRIGAMVSNSDMAHHPLVAKNFPVLSAALLSGASVQLRNLATAGGNLLQRTRCPYFRDTACACNKREPGSGCSAIEGHNRTHAVLGTSENCIATHASDMCVALAALDSKILIQGPGGERAESFSEFYRLPGTTPKIEHNLQPHDLITAIEIPKLAWFAKSTYVKVRDRASYAFALVSAAVAVDIKNGEVQNSRVAFGGVGTVPWRAKEAEASLQNQRLTSETIRKAAAASFAQAKTLPQNAFKVKLAEQALLRAFDEIGGLK